MTGNRAPDDNAILLPRKHFVPLTNYFLSDGKYGGMKRDGSFLSYVVEELIALSVARVAMFEDAADSPFVEGVPKPFRDRILLLGQRHLRRAIEFREGLFGPIFHELGMENPDRDNFEVCVVGCSKTVSERIALACSSLYTEVGTFLLGMDQKLWIDVDLGALNEHAKTLRAYCKDPQSRMNLASLEGLLGTYTTLDAPMLRAMPAARPQLVETFLELVEDEAYKDLSREAGRLGIPGHARRALTLMRRSAQRISLKPGFKHVFDVGAKAITIATRIPMPGSGIADNLKKSGFLPPVVDLKQALGQALQIWKGQRPGVSGFQTWNGERPKFLFVTWPKDTDDA